MRTCFMISAFIAIALSLDHTTEREQGPRCSSYTTCSSCASASSWLGQCRWCDKAPDAFGHYCHAPGSLLNPCRAYENIDNKTLCECKPTTCQPERGYDRSVCSWYTTGDINNPPADPLQWTGGDFLPTGYRTAAQCACAGGSNAKYNPLWNQTVASCIRTSLIHQHMALNTSLRVDMRAATLSWNPLSQYKYVPLVYEMHQKAYTDCCCSGTVAPPLAWNGIFFAGEILPCYLDTPIIGVDIVSSILEFGRCGCGW